MKVRTERVIPSTLGMAVAGGWDSGEHRRTTRFAIDPVGAADVHPRSIELVRHPLRDLGVAVLEGFSAMIVCKPLDDFPETIEASLQPTSLPFEDLERQTTSQLYISLEHSSESPS